MTVLPPSHELRSEPLEPTAPQSQTITIAAAVLIISGALLILGGVLYALTLRRRPVLLRRWSNTSIASWHGVPDNANLWKVHAKGSSVHLPPPDYIPYHGPIAPPLPLPAALHGHVNRPLPSLPGETQVKRETYNALGLRFNVDLDRRVDSIMSDIEQEVGRAVRGYREEAQVIPAEQVKRSLSARSKKVSVALVNEKRKSERFLGRSQSQKLLRAFGKDSHLARPVRAATAPQPPLRRVASTGSRKVRASEKVGYPFIGFGS